MRCKEIEEILLDGREATLSPSKQLEMEAHLHICESCQSMKLDLGLVRAEAAGLSASTPRGIAMRAAKQAMSMPRRTLPLWTALKPAMAVAACAAVLVGVWRVAVGRQGPRSRKDSATIAVALKPDRNGADADKGSRPGSGAAPEIPHSGGAPPIRSHGLATSSGLGAGMPPHAGSNEPNGPIVADLAYLNASSGSSAAEWVRSMRPGTKHDAVPIKFRPIWDDFVYVAPPRLAGKTSSAVEAVERYRQEKEIVDPRLTMQKVSLAIKGASLSELCRRLSHSTGIKFTAGKSVAEDKITVFCNEKPLRDLMRQINQLFGYLWARTGKPDAYEYELFQDLKSQLAEEALRNRDRDEALLDLDRKMQDMRKFMSLSPEEAHKKAWSPDRIGASRDELEAYNTLGGPAWAGTNLYYDLSRDQLTALRNGETLHFTSTGGPGQERMPADIAAHFNSSLVDTRVVKAVDGRRFAMRIAGGAGEPLDAHPDGKKCVDLRLDFAIPGNVSLWAGAGIGFDGEEAPMTSHQVALGMSPGSRDPKNAELNAALAKDPKYLSRITLQLKPSIWGDGELKSLPDPVPSDQPFTIADVLEAIHKATGVDVIGDHFTRLYPGSFLQPRGGSLFDTLCKLCDKMRVHWDHKEGWLHFRSTSYFVDRVTEIPNPLLSRWCAMRKKAGYMTPEIMMEVAQLSNEQLDNSFLHGGPGALFGLREWYGAGSVYMRPHWRFLSCLTPDMRKQALGAGLDISKLSIAQQGRYFALCLAAENDRSRPRKKPDWDFVSKVQRNVEISHLDGSLTKAAMPDTDITYRFKDPQVGPWAVQIHLFENQVDRPASPP